jgi:hypothetical protein
MIKGLGGGAPRRHGQARARPSPSPRARVRVRARPRAREGKAKGEGKGEVEGKAKAEAKAEGKAGEGKGQGVDKRFVFFVNTCPFFLAVASDQRALTPAIRRFFFADASQIIIMFLHD